MDVRSGRSLENEPVTWFLHPQLSSLMVLEAQKNCAVQVGCLLPTLSPLLLAPSSRWVDLKPCRR